MAFSTMQAQILIRPMQAIQSSDIATGSTLPFRFGVDCECRYPRTQQPWYNVFSTFF